jgi:hypothetical protein
MGTAKVSPLRQRMIEDMNARTFCAGTQRGHIQSWKRFAAFLNRSPDTATVRHTRWIVQLDPWHHGTRKSVA